MVELLGVKLAKKSFRKIFVAPSTTLPTLSFRTVSYIKIDHMKQRFSRFPHFRRILQNGQVFRNFFEIWTRKHQTTTFYSVFRPFSKMLELPETPSKLVEHHHLGNHPPHSSSLDRTLIIVDKFLFYLWIKSLELEPFFWTKTMQFHLSVYLLCTPSLRGRKCQNIICFKAPKITVTNLKSKRAPLLCWTIALKLELYVGPTFPKSKVQIRMKIIWYM